MKEIIDDDPTPTEGLSTFFDSIWGEVEGYVYLPTRDQKANTWIRTFFKWPTHKKHIINHVLLATAKGLDSYFAPALFKEPTGATKENVLGTSVLWAEFDGTAPEKWILAPSEPHSPTPETASTPTPGASPGIQVISPPVPPPSMRVQSSKDGYEHVYWKLDDFTTNIDFVENSNRSIAYTLRADFSGWDIGQVLRPPYTTNYKHDLPVTVISNDNIKYNRTSFKELKPALKLVSDSIDEKNLPDVAWIMARYRWDKEHFQLMMDSNIEEGNRSHALMRLGYYCAEQGMEDVEAFTVLSNASERWGKFTGRLDRKKRLLDIVNRARQKHPQAVDSLTFKSLQDESSTGTPLIYGFKDFIDSEIEIEWAVDGFIEKGGMGMVSSAPGVGKTQLSIQFAISCALGIPFFCWNTGDDVQPFKVLFLSLEMSHVALKIFMKDIAKAYPDKLELLNENLLILPVGEALPIKQRGSKQLIESIIEQHSPKGIIIDALGKLISGKLEEDTAKEVNDYMGIIRNKYECFIWLVHHNVKASKDNKQPNKLEDVFGSTYITADMTTVLTMWKNTEGKIELNQVKARLTKEAPTMILTRTKNLQFIETDPLGKAANEVEGIAEDGTPFALG